MRAIAFLIAVGFVTCLSFFSSAETSRGVSLARPEAPQEAAMSRCAKKITIGNESACLMQKRKGRA